MAGGPPPVEARDGDARLQVLFHATTVDTRVPVSVAGDSVGPCPDCPRAPVSRSGRLACTDCDRSHALPTGTAILESTCECGLPRIAVTRGERFEVCADRGCDPLDTAVSERFNRRFDDCPDCDSDLRVIRVGGLLLGCDAYPDCDVSLSLPTRESDGTCAYGLATFDGWCLDPACASPSP